MTYTANELKRHELVKRYHELDAELDKMCDYAEHGFEINKDHWNEVIQDMTLHNILIAKTRVDVDPFDACDSMENELPDDIAETIAVKAEQTELREGRMF